jgi:hypothetical protein
MLSKATLEKVQWLSAGRAAASLLCKGPDEGFAELGWFPMMRGELVRNFDDPADGYRTHAEAKDAAGRYRRSCQAALAAAT